MLAPIRSTDRLLMGWFNDALTEVLFCHIDYQVLIRNGTIC